MSETAQLNEIRQLLQGFEAFDGRTKPNNRFSWLKAGQKNERPVLSHCRIILFQANHGFATGLPDFTWNYAKRVVEGESRLNRLSQSSNSDLRLYEMDTDNASADCLTAGASMDTDELVRSVAYGMMAVEPGLNLLAASAFGSGTEIAAKAILQAHGVNQFDDLNCTRLLKVNKEARGFDCLRIIGGYELAALCGAVIAAKLANIPVLLEGCAGAAVLAVINAEQPDKTDHCALIGIAENIASSLRTPFITAPDNLPANEPGIALAYQLPIIRNDLILTESA